jgi:hypothetical protein
LFDPDIASLRDRLHDDDDDGGDDDALRLIVPKLPILPQLR